MGHAREPKKNIHLKGCEPAFSKTLICHSPPRGRNQYIQQAYDIRWVVHCEPSLARADHVVKYLGQYTHRVAITNQRILNITDGKITFIARDYRDRAIKKPVTLATKRNLDLQFVREEKPDIQTLIKQKQPPETNLQRFERLTGVNPCKCPVCKTILFCTFLKNAMETSTLGS